MPIPVTRQIHWNGWTRFSAATTDVDNDDAGLLELLCSFMVLVVTGRADDLAGLVFCASTTAY